MFKVIVSVLGIWRLSIGNGCNTKQITDQNAGHHTTSRSKAQLIRCDRSQDTPAY